MKLILLLAVSVLLISFTLSGKVAGRLTNRSLVISIFPASTYNTEVYRNVTVSAGIKLVSVQQGKPVVLWNLSLFNDTLSNIEKLRKSFIRNLALGPLAPEDYLFYEIIYTSGNSVFKTEKTFYVTGEGQSLKIPI